ncbi:MAG: hypothetical protein M1299_00810, partial [Firmicutes bacterium]|nr:hypothetical protein [Bacillota bacterium]
MDYAEEKSVYYWLQKGGFAGIRGFREAVLRGEYQVNTFEYTPRPSEDLVLKETLNHAPGLRLVPLIKEINRQGEVVLSREGILIFWPGAYRKDALAFRCPTANYSPWFWEEDLLILSPGVSLTDGSFVLTGARQEARLARFFFKDPPSGESIPGAAEVSPSDVLLLHPVSGQVLSPQPFTILGRVVKLFRDFV